MYVRAEVATGARQVSVTEAFLIEPQQLPDPAPPSQPSPGHRPPSAPSSEASTNMAQSRSSSPAGRRPSQVARRPSQVGIPTLSQERLSAQLEEAAKRQVMEAAAKAMRKLLRVTEEEWMDLLDGAVHKTFERGVQLMTEGERNDGLLQLIRGRLRNEQKMPGNLKARVLGRPFEGELLGEGGFLRGVPPVFDVVCESEEVDMIFFSKDSLVALFASQPKLAAKFYYLLAVRLAMQLYHSAGKDEFEIVLLDDGSPLGAHAPKTIQALASEPAYMLVFDQFVHADPKLSRGVGQLVRCVRKVLALQKCGDLMSVNHMVERIYTDYIDGPQRMSQLEGTAFSATAMRALIDRAKQDGAPALRHTFDDVLKLCLVVLEACMPPFTASLHYMYIQELLDREQIPVELEHFQGQQWIGQGSYGTVFQVRKRDTGTRYAMKSMKKSQLIEKLGDELWQAVVLAERQILGRLNHPLIVNLAYAFQNVDYLWLVMDCCDGGDLDAFGIDGQQKMDAVQLRFVGMEITSILAHLYGACCLFRDLKPSNLLLDSSGHCRLADFGTAKMAEKASATEPPESKEYCGSRPYMAPEVQRNLEAEGNEYDLYAGANAYTVACDWFSFGVTMYVLAEQAYPFGPDPKYKNLDKEYVSPSLRGHSDEQTVHMRDFLSGLLDWDPQRRYGGDKARIQQLRDHPYWHEAGLRPDWELAEAGQVTSPLKDLAASFMKCRQASFTSRAAAPANNVFSVFQESVATQKRLDAEEYESELELERVVEGWEFVSHQCLAKEFIQGVATNERVSVGTGNRHVSVDFYDLNNFD